MKKRIKVAINGFGRIGRVTFRNICKLDNVEVVAINDLADNNTLAHLLKYDSVHGKFDFPVSTYKDGITVDGINIPLYSKKNPSELPWRDLGVDIVVESTGIFRSKDGAQQHIDAGAKKVIISAPSKDEVKTVVLGVNDHILNDDDIIISNASCTTNNAAPMIKILDENFGVKSAYITTVHAFTGDQNLHDAPHKDLRRARSAPLSIIPTTTGAAKAVTEVFPHLKGMVGGAGIRVPVPDGSLTDITCVVEKQTSIDEINALFKKASESQLKNILQYTEDPIVSIDIVGSPYSCVFDSLLTSVIGNVVKVVGWYDNEMGYSNRLTDLIQKIG